MKPDQNTGITDQRIETYCLLIPQAIISSGYRLQNNPGHPAIKRVFDRCFFCSTKQCAPIKIIFKLQYRRSYSG